MVGFWSVVHLHGHLYTIYIVLRSLALSVYVCLSLSVCVCVSLSVRVSLSVSVSLSLSVAVCLSLSRSLCVRVSLSLSVCLSVSFEGNGQKRGSRLKEECFSLGWSLLVRSLIRVVIHQGGL